MKNIENFKIKFPKEFFKLVLEKHLNFFSKKKYQVLILKGKSGDLGIFVPNNFLFLVNNKIFFIFFKKKINNKLGLLKNLVTKGLVLTSQGFFFGLKILGVGYNFFFFKNFLGLNIGFSVSKFFLLPKKIKLKLWSSTVILGSSVSQKRLLIFFHKIFLLKPFFKNKGMGVKKIKNF